MSDDYGQPGDQMLKGEWVLASPSETPHMHCTKPRHQVITYHVTHSMFGSDSVL